MDVQIYRAIERWAGEMDGVFALSDLRVVLGDCTDAALYKRLNQLIEGGVLIKVKRGLYATPEASLSAISHRIEPAAYISTGTVLASAAIIGSVPARRIQAVKTGRPRVYSCRLGVIEHLSISPKLYFGFSPVAGILYASPEKAFLDTCYYSYRGKRFSFDPDTDVDTDGLSQELIDRYLKKYDARFAGYFSRIWGERW